jgi:hypothetical protein
MTCQNLICPLLSVAKTCYWEPVDGWTLENKSIWIEHLATKNAQLKELVRQAAGILITLADNYEVTTPTSLRITTADILRQLAIIDGE